MDGNNLTLGSLFDGSGGFPLGAMLAGITPVWASEIEPFPIRVTTKRFPNMLHLGNIKNLDGGMMPPVDIISFGSPCQDLSVAGNRSGLRGKKSSLFYDAIKVVKEMREKTDGEYPRFIIWENVLGAFSSNKGKDFQTVLGAIIGIKKKGCFVPMPPRQKWASAGEIMANDFSIAWRVFDAQFWGVPQRRKRIYLVADFTGRSAGKILFKSENVFTDPRKNTGIWKKASSYIGSSFEKADELTSKECIKTKLKSNNHIHFYDIRITSPGTKIRRHSCRDTKIVRTLDTHGNMPASNQGGVAVVYDEEKSNKKYVRRLTPAECGRLQGFPIWWCDGLGVEDPTEKEIEFWKKVFKEYSVIMGKQMIKTDKQIRKWLKQPRCDTAEYKMWGNGVALPNVFFILLSIKMQIITQ